MIQVISKILQILGLQSPISKNFSIRTIFSHTRSEQFCKQNTSSWNLLVIAKFIVIAIQIRTFIFKSANSINAWGFQRNAISYSLTSWVTSWITACKPLWTSKVFTKKMRNIYKKKMNVTTKRMLERLGIQTSSSFVKIW